MIRREWTSPGKAPGWLLISQIDHARLSAKLAEKWGFGPAAFLDCSMDNESSSWKAEGNGQAVQREVMEAIRHHDDGWAQWESCPSIDHEHGRPLSFMEMPLGESIGIWQQSVLDGQALGPLAAWMIAGHFADLLRGSSNHSEPIAVAWLADMETRRNGWLAQWQAKDERMHTVELAHQALKWLRGFDALSLWFCCGSTSEFEFPDATGSTPPRAEPVAYSTVQAAGSNGPALVVARPWPLCVEELMLTVPALHVPVRTYRNGEDVLAAGVPHRLRVRLLQSRPS